MYTEVEVEASAEASIDFDGLTASVNAELGLDTSLTFAALEAGSVSHTHTKGSTFSFIVVFFFFNSHEIQEK